MELREIENIELKYMDKLYHFLKFSLDDILEGFDSREKIRDDWFEHYSSGDKKVSDFSTGAERVIYALLTRRIIGDPNSSPVGSDLMFETEDAYIHIDLKTVKQDTNAGDYAGKTAVGRNQNSYRGNMMLKNGVTREYIPSLPCFYNQGTEDE